MRSPLLVLALALLLTPVAGQDPPRPGTWEHRAVKFDGTEKGATDQLNALAADGWEYVGPLAGNLVAFRRPVLTPEEQAARKDLARLQGVWTLARYEAEGREVSGPDEHWTLTVREAAWAQREGREDDVRVFAGVFADLAPARKPPAVDLVNTAGPLKGATNRAVYKLDGDRLTICFGDERTRPTDFATRPGDRRGLMVWERRK